MPGLLAADPTAVAEDPENGRPDVAAIHSRSRAIAAQRDALSNAADNTISSLPRSQPLVAAMRGLVRELEDLTIDQDAVILSLRHQVVASGEEAETARRRFHSLKAGLRQTVEKNVAACRRIQEKDHHISSLKAAIAANAEATEKAARERSEKDSAVAAKIADFETRIAKDAERRAASDAEWARQADRAATLEQQLRAARRDADGAGEEAKSLAAKLADAEYELLYLSEAAKRADQLASKQRQLVAARAKDAERAAEDNKLATEAARTRDVRIGQLENRLAAAADTEEADAAKIREREARIDALQMAIAAAAEADAAAVGERDHRIAALEKSLASVEAGNADTVRQKDERMAALEERIKTVEAEHSARVFERDERIATLETRIASAEADSAADSAAVQEALQNVADTETALAEANQRASDFKAEVESLQATCTNYASAMAVASHQLAASSSLTTPGESGTALCRREGAFEGQDEATGDTEEGTEMTDRDVTEATTDRSPLADSTRSNVLQSSTNAVTDPAKSWTKESTVAVTSKPKFVFRVDVPDFQPGQEFVPSSPLAASKANFLTKTGSSKVLYCPESSYSNLFWCPPGTRTKTLVNTVHKEDGDRVQVVEVLGDRWADGFALWYDLATALIPGAGCATSPPAEGSVEYWQAIETAFLSVGGEEDEDETAPAPIVFVVRNTGLLAPSIEDEHMAGSCADAACQKICKLLEILHGIHSSLIADRFSVSVILEGWPSSVPLGTHFAQSLALPRVSRRSGKAKRYIKRAQQSVS